MKKFLLIISIFLIIAGASSLGIIYYWQTNLPLVSPVALLNQSFPQFHQNTKTQKIVYGFLPYWNLKYADQLNISQLTHFAYFALDLQSTGEALTHINKRELEPGYNKLKSKELDKLLFQTRLLNIKNILTITAMDVDGIETLLGSEENINRAITTITDHYKQYNFDSLNIDFEHIGVPDGLIRANFVSFISKLRSACKAIKPQCQIDIDIFGDTVEKNRLHDIKALEPYTDHFIVMSYDYFRKSSKQAGPVAPLNGKCQRPFQTECLEADVTTHIASMVRLVPPEKLILGVPFYGYEWEVASDTYLANTYPKTGSLASYSRIRDLWENPKVSSISARWNQTTLSPWLSYVEDKKLYQIHYEDVTSLTQKVKFVQNNNLAGIAIWALGYETPYNDLWQPLSSLNLSK